MKAEIDLDECGQCGKVIGFDLGIWCPDCDTMLCESCDDAHMHIGD